MALDPATGMMVDLEEEEIEEIEEEEENSLLSESGIRMRPPLAESTLMQDVIMEEDDSNLGGEEEEEEDDDDDENGEDDEEEEDDDDEDDDDEEEDEEDEEDSRAEEVEVSEEDDEEEEEDELESGGREVVEVYPPPAMDEDSNLSREDEEIPRESETKASVIKLTKIRSAAKRVQKTEETAKPQRRRPGRPPKAEVLRKAKEKQERMARGEPEPPPKRRGRKPMPPEEKARLKEERRQAKIAERAAKRRQRVRNRDEVKEEVVKRRKRRPRVLTEEEKAAKEEIRKQKYEEFKRAKAEKAAKREERNKALREYRKQKKEQEKKQREAYEKRMQELKASFLDENSHLSTGAEAVDGILDESSQMSFNGSKSTRNNEMQNLATIRQVTAETLFEYRWPLEGKNSEHYFLQEQVCEYLGIKSFKRRYPDLQRRNVEHEERDFLVEMRVVNETQADLGLTALLSSTVLDIMSSDFYEKYDEYMAVVTERKDKIMRQTNYNQAKIETAKIGDFVEKSIRSAADWNKTLNQEKKEKRTAYFDLQTFTVHHPVRNKGQMKVVQKPRLGNYPVALILGQFVDYFQHYTPAQLSYLPLNSTLKGPPKDHIRLQEVGRPDSEGIDSHDDSSSSGSESSDSSDSSSDSSDSSEEDENTSEKTKEEKLKRPIDAEIPGAKCKLCLGDRSRNKIGVPEKLLHCSKCDNSMHPTCIGLSLDLLEYVTKYNWECTDCKNCSKCKDHSDEDKMLFCDLCDRGYHNYCVGLDTIPVGRWHCVECTFCISCKVRNELGTEGDASKWVLEYKTGPSGNKVYSHTMCTFCHKSWKKGQFCPECTVVFGRESKPLEESDYANCWVCARQHHLACVGQATFICAACQRRTLEKTISPGENLSDRGLDSNSQHPETKASNSAVSTSRKMSIIDNTNPVVCEICHKTYKNKSTLYSHKNRDHGVKSSSVK